MTTPLFVVAGPMATADDPTSFQAAVDTQGVIGATINASMAASPNFPDFVSVANMTQPGMAISAKIVPMPAPAGMPTVQIGDLTLPDMMDAAYPAAAVEAYQAFFTMAENEGILPDVTAFRLCLVAPDSSGQFGLGKGDWPGAHFTEDGVIAATTAVVQGIAAISAALPCQLWVSFYNPGEWIEMAKKLLAAIKGAWPGTTLYVGTVYDGGALSRSDAALIPLVDGGGVQMDPRTAPEKVKAVAGEAGALVPALMVLECHHIPNNQPALIGAA